MDARAAWREVVTRHLRHPGASGGDRYWAPELETADRGHLAEIQSEKLAVLVRFLYEESAGYRRLFEAWKLKPADVTCVADLWKIPVTTREDLSRDQTARPPWGELPPVSDELWGRDGWLFFSTSGTSGQPVAFRTTRHDREVFIWLYCRALHAGGVRSGNVALNCFSYGPFSAFWGIHLALNGMGCAVIPGGGMDTARRAAFVARFHPTILIGTPSYLLYLADAVREAGGDPARAGVRFLTTAGEPGPCIPATRARLRGAWGGAQVLDHYGCTEVAPAPLAYTCAEQAGREDTPVDLHLSEDMYVVEVVNPDTLEPVPPGGLGVIVCTNLWSEGQPFLRYRIGDYLSVTGERCECGRTHARAVGGFAGRPDDMLKIRGVVVFPSTIEALVRAVPELSNEFLLVVGPGPAGRDELTVQVEPVPGVGEDRFAQLRARVTRDVRVAVGIRADVDVLPPGTLPRTQFKARRVTRAGG